MPKREKTSFLFGEEGNEKELSFQEALKSRDTRREDI